MNDEVRQIREETFNYIILAGIVLSLVVGIGVLIASGPASPWFIRSVALFLIMGMAWVIRLSGKFVTATYLLVIELVGLVAETFLHTSAIVTFTPYLLIPIMLIAGFFFTPLEALAVTGLSLVTLLLIAALAHQFILIDLIVLAPPFILTILTTLLGIKLKQGMTLLGDRLIESRIGQKARALEIITVQKKAEEFAQKAERLEQRLQQARFEIGQSQHQHLQTHDQVHRLIQGVTQELTSSLKNLEETLSQVEEQPAAEAQRELLGMVWRRMDHLRGLAIKLEELAQVEHGQIELDYDLVDVPRLLDEVVEIARGLARGKNLEIRRRPLPELPLLQADPARLRHVLLHLLSNAVNYTDEGVIDLQAGADEIEMTIIISDTGMGLPAEETKLVFEQFGRSSSPPAQARQGTGLGLAIDKRLIELHGGRILLTSTPGVGSTVSVILPLIAPRSKDQPAPKDEPPATGGPNAASENDATELSSVIPALASRPDNQVELPVFQRAGVISSEPVRRFGAIYIRRLTNLGLISLAGLALLVVILAVIYGPVEQPTLSASEPLPTVETTPTVAALVVIVEPTFTPSPSPTATASPTPSPQPTSTQTSTPRPQALPATLPPTSTPEPPPSPTPTATPTLVPSSPTPQPVQVDSSQLSFSAGQNNLQAAGFVLDEANSDLKVVDENSRLGWSPDGQRLLFTADEQGEREIYVINQANGRPVQLTAAAGDDFQADWSPDGRQIAFSSGRTGNLEIYVMNIDGSNLVQLTDSPGFDEWPVWSPAGDQIAFVSDREGNVELYVMKADGSNLQRLTNNPANDWPASWSPDGRRLVFASDRNGNWNLYVVAASGGPSLPLTIAPGNERDPIWSPDGQTIAFAHDGSGNWDIHTLPAPPAQVTIVPKNLWRQITATATDERYPTWKP